LTLILLEQLYCTDEAQNDFGNGMSKSGKRDETIWRLVFDVQRLNFLTRTTQQSLQFGNFTLKTSPHSRPLVLNLSVIADLFHCPQNDYRSHSHRFAIVLWVNQKCVMVHLLRSAAMFTVIKC